MLDITKLPEKYIFPNESLTDGKYIDDNSLFVYFCISRDFFSYNSDIQLSFLYFKPFEWSSIDFISFLLSVAKKYNLEITHIQTIFGAVKDEYEIPDESEQYGGAYQWILDLTNKEPNREEVILFNKFLSDTATISDIERALIYTDRIAPVYKDEKSDLWLSKNIFKKILSYTSFALILTDEKKSKLRAEINTYLTNFSQGTLTRNDKAKKVGNTYVNQSKNIFTFKKHSSLFREYLLKMQTDFGNILTIENIFEGKFPNIDYPGPEFIRKRYDKKNFFFIHILLTFQKEGLLKLLSLGSTWSFHEDKMLAYQAEIEIQSAFLNEELSKNLYFDKDKSRFYVQGKEIKLLKFKDEYHTLRIIFENPEEISKEWFFSEIRERVDGSNFDDKKYYNAIYQIKIKLGAIGVNDFFITTKQSVKINRKYLS